MIQSCIAYTVATSNVNQTLNNLAANMTT